MKMAEVLLPPTSKHISREENISFYQRRKKSLTDHSKAQIPDAFTPTSPVAHWGRSHQPTWSASLSSLGIMALCPSLVLFTWISLKDFNGSLQAASTALIRSNIWEFFSAYGPTFSLKASAIYAAWILFQAALYNYLPAELSTGQLTPAGNLLQYYTNGFNAWVVTHAAFLGAVYFNFIDPAWIARNWAGFLVAINIYGILLSVFAYVKAYVAPTHADDRKFSGSVVYDFYMGIELNPRLGEFWDFKLFHNGRPGIVAWTLIDVSFLSLQHQLHGCITNSMILVNFFHALYALDLFRNEDWYLRTIDISHDHFGFYLAWGSVVWLPTMYTLQAQYLAYYPVRLPLSVTFTILCVGLSGYAIFRGANHQKDIVRRTGGDCLIWGRKAQTLKCKYITADGKERESLLLCSGWWGISRHANYLGDLVMAYCMCMTCGFGNVLPWFYAVFMTVLLLHRIMRSEESCRAKYGQGWKVYCARVKWVLVPGIW